MRGRILSAAGLALGIVGVMAGVGAVRAESGTFIKNLMGGSSGGGEGTPSRSGPRLFDPSEAYCPTVTIREGGSAVQAFAGAAGDNTRLRHQITFGRISRECTPRADGALGVKVGVELRALLGPAGASGSFEAPLSIMVKIEDKILDSRTRRVRIAIPAGAAQGTAAVIEEGLIVPADKVADYDIEVALSGAPARAKAPHVAAKRSKPAPAEASAEGPAQSAGQ